MRLGNFKIDYEYEKGERLICREYTKVDNKVFNVNFEYEIVAVCDNNNFDGEGY